MTTLTLFSRAILTVVLAWGLTGCTSAGSHWRIATQESTVASYQSFLQRHPKDAKTKAALKRIAGFGWSERVKEKYHQSVANESIEAYEHFLDFCTAPEPYPPLFCYRPPPYLGSDTVNNLRIWHSDIKRRRFSLIIDRVRASLLDYVTGSIDIIWLGDGKSNTRYSWIADLLEHAGVYAYEGPDSPDVVLIIEGSGTGMSDTYYDKMTSFSKPRDDDPGVHLYTGAQVKGTISLQVSNWLFSLDFKGTKHTKTSTYYKRKYKRASGAPFEAAFRNAEYYKKVLYLLDSVLAHPGFLTKVAKMEEAIPSGSNRWEIRVKRLE